MQTVTLNNGVEMPIIGFGVFQIPDNETQAAVEAALEAGYRSTSTLRPPTTTRRPSAPPSSPAVSHATSSGSPPSCGSSTIRRQRRGRHQRAFDKSLDRLGLDYLDLYLIHQPLGDYYSEWRAMQQIHKDGGARAIGVSNFHADRLVDLIDHNEITPAVNQIETHPFHQRAVDQDLMRDRGVQIESWGPFAEGKNNLFTDPLLSGIAEDHSKSVAQVVLRWLVQREVVVIPKSVKPERMAQNLDIFDFTLTEEQMTQIATLDTGASLFFDHRDPGMVSWLGGRRIGLSS